LDFRFWILEGTFAGVRGFVAGALPGG